MERWSSLVRLLIKVLFCLSLPCVSFILSTRSSYNVIVLNCILSFLIAVVFVIKFSDIIKKIDYRYLIFSFVITVFLERNFVLFGNSILLKLCNFIYNNFGGIDIVYSVFSIKNLTIIFYLILFPSVIILVYLFLQLVMPRIVCFFRGMSIFEKKVFYIGSIIGIILIGIVYSLTSCFYMPVYNGSNHIYDVIYTSDSGHLFADNVYRDINMLENDIRQPLFGLFSLPFSFIAFILSKILFFLPNSYAIMMAGVQFQLLLISFLLIMRLMKLKEEEKKLFLIFGLCSYSYIVFSFIMEQYIISVFYLILTIYIGCFNKDKVNYLYIGAVGTLITSGILFPLISKLKNFKYWLKNVFNCFIVFVIVTIISGQLSTFLNFSKNLRRLNEFTGGDVLFIDKVKQFLYFVRSLFIAPKGEVVFVYEIPRYHLDNIDFISILGIIILILCIISFIINRKNKIIRISFAWVLFSVVLLCLVGWGTYENGLILYSLYFYWAYLILIYMVIRKILINKKLKMYLMLGLSIIMLIFNVFEFYNILKFGINYY